MWALIYRDRVDCWLGRAVQFVCMLKHCTDTTCRSTYMTGKDTAIGAGDRALMGRHCGPGAQAAAAATDATQQSTTEDIVICTSWARGYGPWLVPPCLASLVFENLSHLLRAANRLLLCVACRVEHHL